MSDEVNDGSLDWWEKERTRAQKLVAANGKNPDDLASLLELLCLDTNKKLLLAALRLISRPTTSEVVDRLKPLAAHSDADVRGHGFLTVADTLKERGLEFYIQCLDEPKFRDKSQPINCLLKYGDESVVPTIIKRTKQIISTRNSRPYAFHNGETELTRCLEFLHPYRERQEVQKVFQRMIEKWKMLDDPEVCWITDQLEYFNLIDLRRPNHCIPAVSKIIDSQNPVFKACEEGDLEKVKVFLDAGGSVYSSGGSQRPALAKLALNSGHIEVLKLLVARGLNIERPVHGFNQFLIIDAIRDNKKEFIDYILDQKIDLNRRDEYGISIFRIICCLETEPELIERLIKLGANIHDDHFRGQTPFIEAARGEALTTMDVLLKHGVNINHVDGANKTALIHAAQGGKLKSVEWLIGHGANLKHVEGFERDALYWAKENKHSMVAELLQKHL
jgi:hypothetical protein